MMKSRKKFMGLVILLAGVVVFVFAKYQHHEGDGKSSINIETNTNNSPVDNTATLEVKGTDHTRHVLGEIVGVILIVAGAGMLYFNRKKHH